MKGETLPITGEGTETRDRTYVGDIVNGLLAMDVRVEAIREVFNLGASKDQRVIYMAKEVNRLIGNDEGIQFKERSDWNVMTRLLSCITKAEKKLGYKPQIPFENGLRKPTYGPRYLEKH